MRVLAVSYVVPPMLYPQAIQIGRLLSHTPGEIAVVSSAASGSGAGSGLDVYPDFEAKLALHIGVPPERPAARLPPMCVPLISVAANVVTTGRGGAATNARLCCDADPVMALT